MATVFFLCLIIIATVSSSSISAQPNDVFDTFAQALQQTNNITADSFNPTTLNMTKNASDDILTAFASATNGTETGAGDVINGAASSLNMTPDAAGSLINKTATGGDHAAIDNATSAVNKTVNGAADGIIGGAASAANKTANGTGGGASSVVNGTKGGTEVATNGTKQDAGDHSEASTTTAFSSHGWMLLLVFPVMSVLF